MEAWQYDDWRFAWDTQECCILRSRGGSKTKDFVDWLILRVLYTGERWAWMAAKIGQLIQASVYFEQNPFFLEWKTILNRRYAVLKNGGKIAFGCVSTSMLGMRLDGYVVDEEEDMEPKQSLSTFPQMKGMLITSQVAKTVHLGTRWINTVFDEHCDTLPTSVHDWTYSPQINASFIEKEKKLRPAWEIDLLYNCLRTAPGGKVFTNVVWVTPTELNAYRANQAGIDINAKEAVVEIYKGGRDVWITREYEADFVHNQGAFSLLKDLDGVEVEDGGYNSKEAELLCQYLSNCRKQLWDVETKSQRMTEARQLNIHVCRQITPNIAKDLDGCVYDPKTGLYFKHPTQAPCHWLDAFLHSIGLGFAFRPRVRKSSYTVH